MAYDFSGFRVSVMPQTNFLDPRLFAPNANLNAAAQAGLATAGQFGTLADLINQRRRIAATQDAAIAAENAQNNLSAATSGASLVQLPQRTLVANRELALKGGQLTGQLSNLPTQQELDAAVLQANAEEAKRKQAVLAQTTEPRTSTDILNADLALGQAQTAAGAQEANSQAALNNARVSQLESELNLNKQESVKQFISENPNAPVKELQAHINKIDADNARALAQIKAGGLTPTEQIAQENQSRLSEYNTAQAEVARQNAATNAAKLAATINDPAKLAKAHLDLEQTVLSNGQTVKDFLSSWKNSEGQPRFHGNLSPADQGVISAYQTLSSRMAGVLTTPGVPGIPAAPAAAPAAVTPTAATGPYSAYEGKILVGPGGSRVKIVNGKPVVIQ